MSEYDETVASLPRDMWDMGPGANNESRLEDASPTLTDLELFRSWWNDFLTVDAFASHYHLTRERAEQAINRGRDQHNAIAAFHKKDTQQ